ncbi:putative 2OG-Fe(II) oxygenase [Marinibaculum pumilum]|uniref:2OG-Fe(II) oxygenase n=1 Tax=Marinibaculum pumilum TaxID=1766165 RepID=A0ABV7KU10_9PROT
MTGSPAGAAGTFADALEAARQRHRAGEIAAAAEVYERLNRADPSHPEPWHLLAVVAHQTGAQERAVLLAEEAIRRDPARGAYHNTRGSALRLLNRMAEAESAYRRALDLEPGSPLYATNLAVVLLETARPAEALEMTGRALQAAPDDPSVLNTSGLALQALQRLPEALSAFDRAVARAPGFADAQSNRRLALLQTGEAAAARAAAEAWLARMPADRDALTHLAAALAQAGDAPALARLLPLDRHVVPLVPLLADGTAPDAAFNAALARHCVDHPTLQADRHDKATAQGRQTDDLTVGAPPELRALLEAIDRAARRLAADLRRAEPEHPWAGHVPADWRMRVWGTVLHNGGHQRPHTHPAGWLSGVYYVQVPGILPVAEAPEGRAGWIEFGRPDPALNVAAGFQLRDIAPVAGQAVLFPSNVWHRTHPFAGEGLRISIAFDFIPTA